MDSQDLQVNSMRNKWADLTILSKDLKDVDFLKVIKVYEKIGNKYLSQGGIRTMAKDFFLKSGLCYLANQDLIGCKSALLNYGVEDPTFEKDRKGKLLSTLLQACEMRNRDMFTNCLQGYNSMTPFDKVCTKLAVRIKMEYCPEEANALSNLNNPVNLVDVPDKPQPS